MTLLILFAVLSIGFSFLCSILEASLLSITPSYIASLRKDRHDLFVRLRRLTSSEDETNVRGEISALAEIGRDQQDLDEDERRIIQNVLRFHEIKVSAAGNRH